MKLYTEEQIREVLSNMLLTREQVESIIEGLSPQDPAICEYSGLRPVEGYKEEDKIDKKEDTKIEDKDFMYKWIRERSGK